MCIELKSRQDKRAEDCLAELEISRLAFACLQGGGPFHVYSTDGVSAVAECRLALQIAVLPDSILPDSDSRR